MCPPPAVVKLSRYCVRGPGHWTIPPPVSAWGLPAEAASSAGASTGGRLEEQRAVGEAFVADIALLSGSQIVVAGRLFNDAGTSLDAGWAAGHGIPAVMWDAGR